MRLNPSGRCADEAHQILATGYGGPGNADLVEYHTRLSQASVQVCIGGQPFPETDAHAGQRPYQL